MSQSAYRWVIVAAGGLLGCIAGGAMFCLPVLLRPIAEQSAWSTTGVSAAMTLGFLAMAFAGMAWGNLSDRIGPRLVVLIGSGLLALSLAIASRSSSLILFQLVFGLGAGAGVAAIFAPIMACVTGWFDTQRALAVSLVSAGMGMAPMTMAPLAAWIAARHDWRMTMLILAGVVAVVMIPTALLIRRPPALAAEAAAPPADADANAPEAMSMAQALRSPQFLILMATMFFCCATHSGPIIHTVSYAVVCGIPLVAAVSIYSLEGFAGLIGRIVFGVAGDKLGAKRVLVFGLLAQATAALAYLHVRQLNEFYAAAALFGFVYGGIMPLYSVIARENFPLRMMGTVIGGVSMAGGLGMATGPLTGAMIYDRFGSYGGLYIASFVFGLAAFAILMTFRPFPKAQMAAVSTSAETAG